MILVDPNPISYNGYTFPSNVQTVQFDQTLKFDDAGRMVMYVIYRIGLQFHVNATGGGNIDSDIASLRSTLSQHGKAFTYSNRGFGALFTVGPGQAWEDVNFGPKPVGWSVKPKGQNKGTTITWTVELAVPTNCAAGSVFGVAMQAQYKLSTRIDRRGYTTLTISGFVEIPRIVGFERASVSDDFLDAILPAASGFPYMQQTDRSYDHSLDKARTDYTLTFEELTNAALPEGCVEASASHNLASTEIGLVEWDGEVSANYTVANGYGIETAWNAFRLLLKTRIDFLNANLDTGEFGKQELGEQKPGQKPRVMLTGVRLSEPAIYKSDTFAFSARYHQISTLKTIFGDTTINAGLFRFPSTGLEAWNTWVNSLGDVNDPRGLLGIKVDPAAEMLIDLCANDTPRPPTMGGNAVFDGSSDYLLGDITDLQPDPDPETSWFFYEPEIEVYEDRYGVVSAALSDGAWSGYNTSPGDLDAQGYMPDEKPSEETDEVQFRAPPTLIVNISGIAMRAWFPIPRPKIVSYNGNPVKEVSTKEKGCFWRQKIVGSVGAGMPLYYAEWRFEYVITGRPTEPIRPPVNLAEQV